MYAMNSREFKNEIRTGVIYGYPPFSIQIHEKHTMKRKRKYLQVANGLQT